MLEQRALDLSVATYLKRKKATEASPMLLVTEAGSYLRLIDFCVTQLKAQGPSRTCNESKEKEEEGEASPMLLEGDRGFLQSTHPPGCERRPDAPHTTVPNGYISNCRGRRDIENLTRTDTEASGRVRWAHAKRTSLRVICARPSHKTRSYSETKG